MVTDPDCAVVMNSPSLEKFGSVVRPGGLLFVNRSLVPGGAVRDNVAVFALDVLQIAKGLGDSRVANMVMLGAVVAVTEVADQASVASVLHRVLPDRHHHLLELNRKALATGAALVADAAARGPVA